MKLFINLQSMETMKEHAEKEYPNECCGFLFGSDSDIREIQVAQQVPNNQKGDQRKKFEISPLDYMKAERHAMESGQELLGIYHSHPDHPPIPSRHDFRQAVSFFSYIILSVRGVKYKRHTSWRLNDRNQFEQEKVIIDKPELVNPQN